MFLTFKYLYFSFVLKRAFCFITTVMRIMLISFKNCNIYGNGRHIYDRQRCHFPYVYSWYNKLAGYETYICHNKCYDSLYDNYTMINDQCFTLYRWWMAAIFSVNLIISYYTPRTAVAITSVYCKDMKKLCNYTSMKMFCSCQLWVLLSTRCA